MNSTKVRNRAKSPIEQLVNTVPQLAISFSILFFIIYFGHAKLSDLNGIPFYISITASCIMFATFFSLQVKGAEYKNWQQHPDTRKSIQIASLGAVISFLGLHISLWSIYGILTPLLVMAFYTFVLSLISIVTAFSGKKGKIIKP
ncbi:hypothetical protein K501DRAFT_262497 [Backusella circina FSU 941]|nr:hypothetical protein K501DRAFT_262497 [Backusella circina FSU 941]